MNRGQLVHAVARKLAYSERAGTDDLSFLQDLANAAVIDVLIETRCYVDVGDMALTAGDDLYRVDGNILAVLGQRITTSSGNRTYEVVPVQTILDLQQGVAPAASTVDSVAFENDLLYVWPAPAANDTIRFVYVPMPTPMTDNTHDPSAATYGGVPVWGHRALEYYMLWQAAEADSKAAPLSPRDYYAIYQDECNKIQKRVRKKESRSLRPARIGYPGTNHAGRRNDVYPDYSGR